MTVLRVFCFCIALVLLPFTLQGCHQQDGGKELQQRSQTHIERAENYRRQGQFRAAIIEARNALQQNPNDRAANLQLAKIFNELGQGKAALRLLGAHAADASRDEALAIGQAYFLQHKYQSVLEYLAANAGRLQLASDNEANLLQARAQLHLNQTAAARATLITLDASSAAVRLEFVRLQRLEGDLSGSKKDLEALLAQYPENVDVLLEACAQAESSGDLARAEDLLSKILMILPNTDVLTPQKAETLQRLVTTLTKLGRSNEALVYSKTLADANPEGVALQDKLKQALDLFQNGKIAEAEPLLVEVYNESHNETVGTLLGMIRFSKNDLRGAADYLATNVDPETADASTLTALAATQLELAQPNKLLEIFDARERSRVTSPELKALIGIALLQTGSAAEGEKMVAEAQRASPDNTAIASAIARYYLQSKQPLKAIATLQEALKGKSDSGLSRLLIAAYLVTGQNNQALTSAQQLTSEAPTNAESWWVLGNTALQLQNLDAADSALHKALQIQPDYPPAQLNLAQAYLLRRQPGQAVAMYQALLKKSPEMITALKGLVVALSAQGVSGDALERQLLALADNASSRTVLADYFLQRNQYSAAQRLLESVTDGSGDYTARVRQLAAFKGAGLALQSSNFDEARSRVLTGLKLAPQNPDLLVMLARIEQAAGKLEEAKKIAAQLSSSQPQYPPAQELLGDLAMIDRQPQKAAQYYQQAWERTHSDLIGNKLFRSLAATDKTAASKLLQQWRQQNPKSDTAALLWGAQQQATGDIAGAIASYEAAIANNPDNAHALNNLAILYQEKNDARALATAERAYKSNSKDPAIMDTYGWLLVKNHQREKGIQLLQDAAALVPESEEIKQHLRDAQSSAR